MAENRVNAALTVTARESILASLASIREQLPFLIDLTAADRRSMIKLGDRSRAFVSKALEVATQNSNALPRAFNVEEMRKDVQLFEDLQPVIMAINKLQDLVEDTMMEAGSEAYAAALAVYAYVKTSSKDDALEVAADDLGRRFVRKHRQPESDAAGGSSKA